MERKNKVAGQQTRATQNTRNYEERILHEPLAHELATATWAQDNSTEVVANGPSNMANYQGTFAMEFLRP